MCVGLVQSEQHYYLFELNIGLLYVSVASITTWTEIERYIIYFNLIFLM